MPTPDAIGQGADGAHAGLAIELTPRVEQSPSAHIVLVIAIKQGEVSARVAGAAPQVLPGVGFPMTQVTIFLHSPTQDTLEITTTEPNGPHYRLEVNATAVPMASASAGPAQGTVIALRIYPIRDLITDVPGGPPAIRIGDLVDLIRQSCGDGPWPAGSLGVLPTDGGSIVVRQTRQVHECIEKLLKDLRASRSIRVRLEVGAYLLLRQSEGPGYEVPDGLSTVNLKAQPSGKPSPTMSDLAGAARWHVEAAPVEVGNGQPAKPAALEGLTVRPVVSADRRHVLLEVDPGVPSAGRTVSSDDGATDIVYFEGDAAQQLARRWMKPDELAGLGLDGAYVALTVRPRIEILQEIERPATASASGKLQGSVWVLDHEAALEQYMPELEAAGSKEAFDRTFEQMRSAPTQGPPGQSGAGATLTLRGGRVPQTTVADADGSFQFSVLHAGVYELTGRKPTSPSRTGASRVAEGMTRIEVAPGANSVDLELRTDLVSVRGRVTDTDGHPVAGATVTTVYDDPVDGAGQPIDAAEVLRRHAQWAFAATRTARTDADGVYELRCLEPMDFYATGRYLFTDSTRAPEYVNLRVEAEGFQQPGGKLTRVLLVTQDGLYWGERFMEAAARAYDQLLKKKQDAPLPAVHGNTITGVDIVLERTGPAAKAAAAATSSRTATEQERQRLMGLVEDFFKHNFRDITARDTIEWGDAQVLPNGNRSIRYKYRATIWGKDQLVYNFTFTFDANGEFVSIKDVPMAAGLAAVASIRTYDVNKAVSDFPEGEDLSTPEAAYATLNRLAATGDQGFWRRLSDKDLRAMMPASPPARPVSEDWKKALLGARILFVQVCGKDHAAVTARLAGPGVRQPIDARYFTLEDGRWLNSGNNRFETVEEAVQRFADICARQEYGAGPAPTLEQQLSAVDELRAGLDTDFAEVERRCDELLKRYPAPEDQGKIYFELAQVEGQSGMQHPEKLIGYVKKALSLPCPPERQVDLYVYWGGALQVAHRGAQGEELSSARREAALQYPARPESDAAVRPAREGAPHAAARRRRRGGHTGSFRGSRHERPCARAGRAREQGEHRGAAEMGVRIQDGQTARRADQRHSIHVFPPAAGDARVRGPGEAVPGRPGGGEAPDVPRAGRHPGAPTRGGRAGGRRGGGTGPHPRAATVRRR